MSTNAGNLLWNRQLLTLQPGITDVDTGLTQVQLDFAQSSVNEPFLGIPGTAAPLPGSLPASRVQVIPMAPLVGWQGITHSEPYFNTNTNTVHVAFNNTNEVQASFNVLFWDPDTKIGPGQATPYNFEIAGNAANAVTAAKSAAKK
jgi:hypothetical protein